MEILKYLEILLFSLFFIFLFWHHDLDLLQIHIGPKYWFSVSLISIDRYWLKNGISVYPYH